MYIYKYDMSYNVNLVPNVAPAGTVMQYASPIGATDPSGWVICDGVARSNASGFYNNILTSRISNVANANTTILSAPINQVPGSLPQNASIVKTIISSDGQIIIAKPSGQTYSFYSNNSGTSWSKINITGGSNGLVMSNDASIIAYSNDTAPGIYISTNSGSTFSLVNIYGKNFYPSNNANNIGMSGSGNLICAVTGGVSASAYVSTDTGNTWTNVFNVDSSTYFALACISNNGNMIIIPTISGSANNVFYMSTNNGNTWSSSSSYGVSIIQWGYNAIGMSSNAQYILAGSNSNTVVFLSSSSGKNWTNVSGPTYGSISTSNSLYESISMTSSGNIMSLINYQQTKMYASSNFGRWWIDVTPSGWTNAHLGCQVSISLNTNIAVACTGGADYFYSTNYGFNWTAITSPSLPNYFPLSSNWGNAGTSGSGNPVAVSQNGQIMAAVSKSTGGVYVSIDTGNNWINYKNGSISNSTSTGMTCVSMNSSGSTMVTTFNNFVHISTNTGVFWTQMTCPISINNPYNSIGISGDGTKIIVVGNGNPDGNAYFTTNSGNNWISISARGGISTYFPNTCAINQTGNLMVLCRQDGGSNALFISSNSGNSWVNAVRTGIIISVGISNSGANIIYSNVYTSQTGTWLSTNYGKNFTNVFSNGNACSMSGDGTIMVVAFYGGTISLSTNSGNSWSTIASNLGNKNWDAVQLSNDGTKLLAAVYGESIYVSNTAFSSSTYFSSFTPMNIANTTSTDGTTLKYIMKY